VSKDFRVKETLKGISKLMADGRLEKEVRQPLPASAIRAFILLRGSKPYRTWIRDVAILIIGFRGMRRASEIVALRRKNLVKRDGLFIIRISRSKTDQMAVGREIAIEPSFDEVTCPVKLLEEFLASDTWNLDDFLFRSAVIGRRVPLKVSSISELVKQAAKAGGLQGKFSSHSLRIGGATAGMMGGLSMEQIRSIGHWESDAVLLYLRSVGAAMAGASSKMGL
jgi:integrase